MIWVALLLLTLVGVVGIGVDVGRLRLAQTELQTAADAAARAAAWSVPSLAYSTANARAVDIAAANTADRDPVTLVADDDVTFGLWRPTAGTFTPLTGSARAAANAVRVDARRTAARGTPLDYFFAPVIGVNSADLEATATAMIRGGWRARGHGMGLVGIDWVLMNGVSSTDSYDPTRGAYGALVDGVPNVRDYGTVATNGYVTMVGTSDVNGDARTGPDASDWSASSFGSNTTVTGWKAPLEQEMVFPLPTAPSTNNNATIPTYIDNRGNFGKNGAGTLTLPAGTYVVNDLTLNANQSLVVTGPVKIYASGQIKMVGGVSANGGGPPSHVQIFALGALGPPKGVVDVGGGSSVSAWIYAPGRDVVFHGTSTTAGLFGAVVGKTLEIKGNSAIHYDETASFGALPPELAEFWVELVR